MLNAEQVFQAIQSLPVRERLRIVERVVHELVDDATETAAEPGTPRCKHSPIGWLTDKPEVADAILRSGTGGRAADDVSPRDQGSPGSGGAGALLGLFADEPELVDEVCAMAFEARRRSGARQ